MQPVAADLEVLAQAAIGPQAAAKTIAGFQDNDLMAAVAELTGSDQAGKTGTDHHHIRLFSH
jgi:hypothetical protein